jgi:U3 small nucleolar RNA-associated protein 12
LTPAKENSVAINEPVTQQWLYQQTVKVAAEPDTELNVHVQVWCLRLSHVGDFLLSGSHDRSIRRWEQTDETFFLEEEKEKRLEQILDSHREDRNRTLPKDGFEGGTVMTVSSRSQVRSIHLRVPPCATNNSSLLMDACGRHWTVFCTLQEAVQGVDKIVDALDMMETEEDRMSEPGYQPNVLLMGMTGSQYVLRAVSSIRANDLEAACVSLSFTDALALLKLVPAWVTDPLHVRAPIPRSCSSCPLPQQSD